MVERAWYSWWWPKHYYEVAELPADTETYADERVIPGFIYYYRVKAAGELRDSDYSNEAGVRVKLRKVFEDIIEEILATIQLYPNPASDQITISWQCPSAQELHLRVVDLRGKEYYRWTIADGGRISSLVADVASLREGIYLLEASAGDERILRRFVVRR